MTPKLLISQVRSLELQLAVFRAQLQQASGAASRQAAASLYGVCAGLSQTTEEALEAVKYRPKWEGSPNQAGPS